jgi:acyl-CoA reductase-like NAD-dependent aldehyde dehydrogenase
VAEIHRDYVAGQWMECKSKTTFPNVNPANMGDVVGLFQASGVKDAREACEAASEANEPSARKYESAIRSKAFRSRIRSVCLRTMVIVVLFHDIEHITKGLPMI